MVYGKSARGLPPLKKAKLSKTSQERQDEIQNKLYESNNWWDDWKFQLHRNNFEWVDPKYNPKRVKHFSAYLKRFYIDKSDRAAHFVGHSKLK